MGSARTDCTLKNQNTDEEQGGTAYYNEPAFATDTMLVRPRSFFHEIFTTSFSSWLLVSQFVLTGHSDAAWRDSQTIDEASILAPVIQLRTGDYRLPEHPPSSNF